MAKTTTLKDSNFKIKEKNRLNDLLSLGADGLFKTISKSVFIDNQSNLSKGNFDIITDDDLYLLMLEKFPKIFLEWHDVELIDRYLKNYYKRNSRLKNRIIKLLENDSPIFGTLTFNDLTLNNSSLPDRRLFVVRFLKSQGVSYVANIDYGKANEREHYHFIASSRVDPLIWFNSGYGSCNVEMIRENSVPLRLAKYLNKLVNHSIKKTVDKNQRIIYSRK